MRGTLQLNIQLCRVGGIIPAYAGNTDPFAMSPNTTGDHPRICGEHMGGDYRRIRRRGSSPHMRGTLLSGGERFGLLGIIPAYAGNTMQNGRQTRVSKDHPRICGEHFSVVLLSMPK